MNETLDELLAAFVGALEAERDSMWRCGDVVNVALDDARRTAGSPRLFRRAASALLGQFASAGHCTKAWARQHAEVSGTFGTESRYPDVAFSFFRAVLNAARRTKADARELLDDALAKALTVADLNAMGRDIPQRVELTATCAECGSEQRTRIVGSTAAAFQGMPISCAVCIAKLTHDGGDGREAVTLGTLEAA